MEINEFDENIISSKRLRRELTDSVHSAITFILLRFKNNNSSVDTLDSFITRPLATRSFTKALILPGHKALEGRILNDESKILENEMTKKLMNNSVGVILAFDGWTNMLNQNILGSVFIILEREVIIWKAVDVSSKIFKESEKFKQASIKAIKIALYFKSSLYKYFIGQLQTLQKESYGKYVQITIRNDTRWNSHYEYFRILIKSKGAL
ncbi:hypothetical protein C1646_770210 [Rhizophagus diaphanus]|nr:hypothetical protein C1646_770210 [Rhizophagus diaphanus] [Rhizophagus sp. MUCL 43196]